MNHSTQLVRLIEIAIMTGAAVILDIVSGMFLRMPQGGSVSIMIIIETEPPWGIRRNIPETMSRMTAAPVIIAISIKRTSCVE